MTRGARTVEGPTKGPSPWVSFQATHMLCLPQSSPGYRYPLHLAVPSSLAHAVTTGSPFATQADSILSTERRSRFNAVKLGAPAGHGSPRFRIVKIVDQIRLWISLCCDLPHSNCPDPVGIERTPLRLVMA